MGYYITHINFRPYSNHPSHRRWDRALLWQRTQSSVVIGVLLRLSPVYTQRWSWSARRTVVWTPCWSRTKPSWLNSQTWGTLTKVNATCTFFTSDPLTASSSLGATRLCQGYLWKLNTVQEKWDKAEDRYRRKAWQRERERETEGERERERKAVSSFV